MRMHELRERYGEWAVVTGASSGMGAMFARKLAAAGLNLVVAARRIGLLNELREQLTSEHGVQVRCLQVDLSQGDCLGHLIEACADVEVGMVINNAGSGVPGAFGESDIEEEKRLIRLNCISPMEITRHFLPGMLTRRRGAIIFVSSLMGFQGVPYMANYSATKGYLLNFGESLHHECKDAGVDVLVLAQGATETPGKYLHQVDYSKLPITWMSAEEVVDAALKSIGRKVFVIPGWRNHLTACLSGGLWSRGLVQGIMKRLARSALPSLVLLTTLLVLLPRQAAAWTSDASRTEINIKLLENAIEEYRLDFGTLPDPGNFRNALQSGGYLMPRLGRDPSFDGWEREIILRIPGRHGEFDLYSLGEDGIDNHGEADDVSGWCGVNEGYHYKRYWPRGRFTIIASCALGMVILMAGAVFPWRTVISLAGIVISGGVSLGCYWLLHPGHEPHRNSPLTVAIVVAGLLFVALLANVGVATRNSRQIASGL